MSLATQVCGSDGVRHCEYFPGSSFRHSGLVSFLGPSSWSAHLHHFWEWLKLLLLGEDRHGKSICFFSPRVLSPPPCFPFLGEIFETVVYVL